MTPAKYSELDTIPTLHDHERYSEDEQGSSTVLQYSHNNITNSNIHLKQKEKESLSDRVRTCYKKEKDDTLHSNIKLKESLLTLFIEKSKTTTTSNVIPNKIICNSREKTKINVIDERIKKNKQSNQKVDKINFQSTILDNAPSIGEGKDNPYHNPTLTNDSIPSRIKKIQSNFEAIFQNINVQSKVQ